MAAISCIGPLSSPKGAAYRHDPDVDWQPADSIKFRFSGNAGPLCGGPTAASARRSKAYGRAALQACRPSQAGLNEAGIPTARAACSSSGDIDATAWRRLFFGLVPERCRRIVAVMGFLDNALTLITLLSLFLLGPALGRALVACFDNWQYWSLPIQHLAVGICTMIAVTGMVLVYGRYGN
jgi:hypothetical protein